MPPSRAEFLEHQAAVMNIPKASLDTALGMIKTAAVSFEHLTNDPHWDRFLSNLMGMYEEAKIQREQSKVALTSFFSDSGMREAQCMFHRWDAQVLLLEQIMSLPTQLREQYKGLQGG